MAIPQITPITTPVAQRTDPPEIFTTRADRFVAEVPIMVDEINLMVADMNSTATTVAGSLATITDAEVAAVAAANFKGEWSGLTGALNMPASVSHNGAVWILLTDLADVTASEPSGANSDWRKIDYVSEGDLNAFSERTITAGTGLTGGGNLSADRTFDIDEGGTGDIRGLSNEGKVVTSRRLRTAADFVTPSGGSNWTPAWGSFISVDWVVTANRTMRNPTGAVPGTVRTVWIRASDGTPRTISFGTAYTGPESGLPPEVIVTNTTGFRLVLETAPNGDIYVSGGEWRP